MNTCERNTGSNRAMVWHYIQGREEILLVRFMLRKPGQRLRPDRPRLARMQPFLIYKSNFTVEPLYLAPIFLEETAGGRF